MHIYGHDIRDLYRQLPVAFRVVVVLACFFIPYAFLRAPFVFMHLYEMRREKPGPVKALMTESFGMMDPSLAYNPQDETKSVWMAFTSEELEHKTKEIMFNTRLSLTEGAQGCRNFNSFVPVFDSRSDDLMAPDGETVLRAGGLWRVETPTIVYDPDDPGKEWKVFAYKYYWPKEREERLSIAQHYSGIAYKYATNPKKEWSTEEWLFSAAKDYPPAPYDHLVQLQLNALSPSLQKIVAYARPSAIYANGMLVLTLSAFEAGETTPSRVIMISSKDHGQSWSYAGDVLTKDDLSALSESLKTKAPLTRLAGATLIRQGDGVYLAAVLGDDKQYGQGTFIFAFDDFSKGTLQRDTKTGAPLLVQKHGLLEDKEKNIQPAGAIGGGFAAYADPCPFGMLTAQQQRDSMTFQILKTLEKPVK